MNHDHDIQYLINKIKHDEIQQPWKNKAISALQNALAFVKMGSNTDEVVLDGMLGCTCPEGAIDKNCVVHRG